MAGRKIRDEQEARRCLTAAAQSSQKRADWAREHGIDARSLNAWRINLQRENGTLAASKFQDLRLVELVPTQSVAPTRYRVQCGEFVVEVDRHFDDEVLCRLLAVVVRC